MEVVEYRNLYDVFRKWFYSYKRYHGTDMDLSNYRFKLVVTRFYGDSAVLGGDVVLQGKYSLYYSVVGSWDFAEGSLFKDSVINVQMDEVYKPLKLFKN